MTQLTFRYLTMIADGWPETVTRTFPLGFLESVPEVPAKLKEPETKERKFEEVVKAAVLVLVY